MMRLANRSLLYLCILCVLLLAPFVARPFHIDDPMFIWTARHIVHHPEDFYGFSVNWEGTPTPVARIFPIPPLTSYFLAGVSRFAGWNAFTLHLAYLPLSLLTVIGTYFLAECFCTRPWFCVLLLLLCPAFWVSSTTLMCETPLLCLWIWSILLWVWGQQKSAWFFPLSGVVTALGILTKFTSLGLIPLLALHAILNPASRSTRLLQLCALLLVATVCIAFNSTFQHLYAVGAFANAADYSTQSQAILKIPVGLRLIDTLAFAGGGNLAACLVILIVIWRPWMQAIAAAGIFLLTLMFASTVNLPIRWQTSPPTSGLTAGGIAYCFQFAVLLLLSVALSIYCVATFRRAWRTRSWHTEAFLLSWIAGLFIFSAFLNWSINIRSMLPMIPAVCILVTRGLDRLPNLPRVRTAIAISIGGAIALAVTIGDYHLAATGKAAADILPQQIASIVSNDHPISPPKLWIAGHWGLQYYFEQKGFTEIDSYHPQIKPGDYILFPANAFGGEPRAENFLLKKTFTVGTSHWVATAEGSVGAGFYHSSGYALPFVFGPVPAESFALLKATPDSRIFP
jgi:hypothetical protein